MARSLTEVRGTLAVVECGWSLRLGTAMLEKTVLFFNKLLLLPKSHPAKMMLQLAFLVPCHTWARRVWDIMSDPRLPSPIPDIFDANIVTDAEERLVFTDNTVRRRVLRRYKYGMRCDRLFCIWILPLS